jgi:hypothetical protein
MAKTTTATPGKSSFLKEFLHDNPFGTAKDVNAAWAQAGFDGTISSSLVNKARAEMGLTGNLRRRPGTAAKTRGFSSGSRSGMRNKVTSARGLASGMDRKDALAELEADIDRLMFKAMGIGNLAVFEETLRQARRLLYRNSTRG